jgi:ABC-type multidrug transport system ATPase subunit
MSALIVDSVLKKFENKQILTDVFISCQKGDIIGLLGRNGTGKSTLLKIIFGSIIAENKFVKIGDKISNGLSDNRNLIKYLPQDSFLPQHVGVETLIDLFCKINETKLLKSNELILPILKKKSSQLSSGEKRILEILLIIYSTSTYTLLDEPFNGVAPINKDAIKDLIKKQSFHKGFIITDHDYRNVLEIATRIILIHDGGTKEIHNKNDLIKWGYIPQTT